MQSDQMANCLRLMASSLDDSEAEILRSVAIAIEVDGAKKFGAVATRLCKQLEIAGHKSDLGTAAPKLLLSTAKLFEEAGAGTQAKDFLAAAHVAAFSAGPDRDLLSSLRQALAPVQKTKKPKIELRLDVRQAADDLTAANSDAAKFEAVLKEISKHSKDSLEQVAERYLGFPRKFKSKADILKAIRARQVQQSLDATREAHAPKIGV